MARKPTLGSVAKEAGVSVPTVSQVMRGTGRISEETRERVLRAAKKLHYVPDSRAAAMRSGESREIGCVIHHLANPFNAEVISGVVELLEAQDYLVSILDARDDAKRQAGQIEAFIRNGRGGLLWVPAWETGPDTYAMLRAQCIPTVTFLRPASPDFDHVGIRNAEATAAAATRLADLGHRHIAYLGGTDMTHVRRARISGYQRILAERGLAPPVIWPAPDNKRSGREAAVALLERHPETTAILCNGDMVAIGACLGVTRTGRMPGREVSVIGFDDIEDAGLATPALTTMAVSPRQLGRKLAQVLLNRIQEPNMPVTVSEMSAQLIERETTGPCPF